MSDNDIFWNFNDATISINGTAVTHYLLYEEKEAAFFVLFTTHPFKLAKDNFVTVQGQKSSAYTIALTPRF